MKVRLLTGFAMAILAAASLQQASAQPITLTGTSYTNTFDTIENDMAPPPEWTTYTRQRQQRREQSPAWGPANYAASIQLLENHLRPLRESGLNIFLCAVCTNFLGTETRQPYTDGPSRIVASPFGKRYRGTVTRAAPSSSRSRTRSTGKTLCMSLDFLNLDPTSTRTATWTVDYGLGATPSVFVPVADFTNTAGAFTTTRTNITFPNGTIDNSAGPVWIRIVVLAATTGSGNRQTFGHR